MSFKEIARQFEKQPVTAAASLTAIAASIGLGGAGVWRMVEPGIVAGQAMAFVGAGVAFAGIAVCEMTAAVALLHADRRDAQDAGARKWVARAVFAAAIACNMLAGHQGAGAISDALIEPQRAPARDALASAEAERAGAREALAAFDATTASMLATFDADLTAARQDAAMAVSARRNTIRAKQIAAQDREAARVAAGGPAPAATRAETRVAAAQAALEAAPKPMGEAMRWALAFMFELVKSVLIWVATPRAARTGKARARPLPSPLAAPAIGMAALANRDWLGRPRQTDWSKIIAEVSREAVRAMDRETRTALQSRAKQVAGWCQHARAA